MTSYINVKNRQGLTKLASLIKEAGFHDVKVTIKPKSITLTSTEEPSIQKGLDDLKARRFISFKNADEAAAFLDARIKLPKKSVTRKR